MSKKHITLLLVIIFFSISSNVYAQCPDGCFPHPNRPGVCIGPNCPAGPPGLPIDGGLGFLLFLGAAYGVKRLREKNSNFYFFVNLLTYFPITSNSKFIISPIFKVLKFVFSNV